MTNGSTPHEDRLSSKDDQRGRKGNRVSQRSLRGTGVRNDRILPVVSDPMGDAATSITDFTSCTRGEGAAIAALRTRGWPS